MPSPEANICGRSQQRVVRGPDTAVRYPRPVGSFAGLDELGGAFSAKPPTTACSPPVWARWRYPSSRLGRQRRPRAYPSSSPKRAERSAPHCPDSSGTIRRSLERSGGGVSSVESQPVYQHGVVTSPPPSRANPDVAYIPTQTAGSRCTTPTATPRPRPWLQLRRRYDDRRRSGRVIAGSRRTTPRRGRGLP